jgi:hypoxanthine phosphoribosyltransferase
MGSKKDIVFTPLSWNRFGKLIDKLYKKIEDSLKEKNLTIDAIVPIIREGGFTGLALAFKFNTWKVIPIQFKYRLYKGGSQLEQKTKLPRLLYELPEKPVFLLVDTLPFGGSTAKACAKEFKTKYPSCRVVYASLFQDYTFPRNDKIFDMVVYAVLTDDTGKLSAKEAKKLGVDKKVYLLPWKNEEEERASIKEEDYSYN